MNRSFGSRSCSARYTVKPPTPESKMPIGNVFRCINDEKCSQNYTAFFSAGLVQARANCRHARGQTAALCLPAISSADKLHVCNGYDLARQRFSGKLVAGWARICRIADGYASAGRGTGEVFGGRAVSDRQKPRRFHGQQKRSEEHTSELQSLAYLVCRL